MRGKVKFRGCRTCENLVRKLRYRNEDAFREKDKARNRVRYHLLKGLKNGSDPKTTTTETEKTINYQTT